MAKRSFSLPTLRKRLGKILTQETPGDVTPVSSFPFVSGDTFRLMAGTEFLAEGATIRPGFPAHLAFVSGELACSDRFVSRYAEWVKNFEPDRTILMIHNGDKLPSTEVLRALASMSKAVFCVNLIHETEKLLALPIGLENARLNNNGRLGLYLDGYDPDPELRTRRVLSSFHEETNPTVRTPVRQLMQESRFGYDGFQWKRGEYRSELRRTKFVVCPPGNGNDTHRTWEAVYLGAVPVVLSGSLCQRFVDQLPILSVDSYSQFVGLSDDELDKRYLEVRAKSVSSALAAHWVGRLGRLLEDAN